MEKEDFIVDIIPEAEIQFLSLLKFLLRTHSQESAFRKMDKLLDLAMSLNKFPNRGTLEKRLETLGKNHRFLIYTLSPRKTVKIIYFIEEEKGKVFVTDFFGTEMDDDKIKERSQGGF